MNVAESSATKLPPRNLVRAAVAIEMHGREINEVGFLPRARAEHAPLVKRDVAVAITFLESTAAVWLTNARSGHGSYEIKHAVERWAEQSGLGCSYVGNGSLLCAALYLGVKVGRRIGPNAMLGLRVIPEDAWFRHQSKQQLESGVFY